METMAVTTEENSNTVESINSSADNNKSRFKFQITVEPLIFGIFFAQTLSDTCYTNLTILRTCDVTLGYNASICSGLVAKSNDSAWLETIVQPYVTVLIMGKTIIGSFIPALLSFFLGPWSDLNGRKLLLCAPLLGTGLTFFTYAILSSIPDLPPEYLLFGIIPHSLSGGFINFITGIYCYTTDITTKEQRAVRIAIVNASLSLGLVCGAITASFMFKAVGDFGYVTIFCMSGLMCCVCFIYSLFFLPETVTPHADAKGLKKLFNFSLVKDMFYTCFKKRENYRRSVILLIVLTLSTSVIILQGEASVTFLFTRQKFGWSLPDFTTWLSFNLIMSIMGGAASCWFLVWNKKIPDAFLGIIAFITKVAECTLTAFIPSDKAYLYYCFIPIGMFGTISSALCRAILSKIVPRNEIGKVFSFTSSWEALTPLAASPLYTFVYNSSLRVFPGAFYLLSAGIYLTDALLLGIVFHHQMRYPVLPYETLSEEE